VSDGSEFKVCGAATENARRANSVWRVEGWISRCEVLAGGCIYQSACHDKHICLLWEL